VCLFSVGAGMLHCIGHTDSLQYKHILQNVMVPSVRMLYPDGIIHFQQDHCSIHDSRVVKEWLSLQADVELNDWPQQAPDMNPIDKTWLEVKRTMLETSLPETAMSYGPLCQTRGMKLLRLSVTFDH